MTNRLLGLELLRGVAALLVLGEHLRFCVWVVGGPALDMPYSLNQFEGYWGVDIFFVLSGYLIGMSLDKPGATPRAFLLARFARVLPLYFVASVACLLLRPFGSYPVTPTVLVTTATLLPLAGDALEPIAAHPYGWTLCYEMAFYLTATALAAAAGPRRAVGAMIGLFTLAPLAFTALGPVPGWGFPSFALSPLTAEFAFGLLAYRVTERVPLRAGWLLLAVGVAGCVRGGFADGNYGEQGRMLADPLLAWTRVTRYGLPAAVGVLGLARLDRAGTFAPVARAAAAAGAASYSLYLVQPFAFTVVCAFAPLLGFARAWPTAAATVAVTLAAAAATARYLDRPLHDLAKGYARRLSAPAQASPASRAWTFARMRSRTAR